MGIHNRDYYRDEAPPGYRDDGFGQSPSDRTVRSLIIACAVVFFAIHMTADRAGSADGLVGRALTLTRVDLQSWQLWRVVTYGFCHFEVMHLFFNMISLWVLGKMVESVRGSRETFWFFIAAVAVSGLTQIAWDWKSNPGINLLGASGGVFGLIVLAAMHFPRQKMQLMFIPIDIELRFMAILFLVMGVFAGPRVAHVAHFSGAAFGAVYYLSGFRLGAGSSRRSATRGGSMIAGWLARLKPRRKPPKGVQLYEPPSENLDAEVDRILDKMNTQGKSSLTPDEQATLDRASKEYRNRS